VRRAEVGADEDLSTLSATSILERRSKPFLTLVALMAILDPPRDEAIEAVKVAHRAGITVKMITGVQLLAWQLQQFGFKGTLRKS
jgi:cation transport ATPase